MVHVVAGRSLSRQVSCYIVDHVAMYWDCTYRSPNYCELLKSPPKLWNVPSSLVEALGLDCHGFTSVLFLDCRSFYFLIAYLARVKAPVGDVVVAISPTPVVPRRP